jgi:hypothetical protein
MTHHERRRLNLTALERDVLNELAHEQQRWYTSAELTANLGHYEHPVVISALNALRHRDLVTAQVRSIGADVKWAMTTLGEAAWRGGEQLSILADYGGGFRNA